MDKYSFLTTNFNVPERPRFGYENCYDSARKSGQYNRFAFNLMGDEGNDILGLYNVEITKVVFNKPATIVFWNDSTKTVVKCEGEEYDPEKGLAMAIVKKMMGSNKGSYYNIFKKWLPKD